MKKIALLILGMAVVVTSCKKNQQKTISVNISGLENLGSDFVYEGWMIFEENPVSTGTFTVNDMGTMSKTDFDVDKEVAESGSKFVLTIEPANDTDPKPSNVHLVAGDMSGGTATLNVTNGAALGDDYSSAMGTYILATPTDGPMTNETSGVWFLDPTGAPDASLTLPTLPSGWIYEGWAVIDGTPISTGKFTDTGIADNDAPYSGTLAGPPFPGEDFIVSAPTGLTFPTDLSDGKIVISIEPVPDNSTAPFLLKPLVGTVPSAAVSGTNYTMDQNLSSLPTGSVTVE